MIHIPLGGKKAEGKFALIDDADHVLVKEHRWHVGISLVRSNGHISTHYALNSHMQYMHRVLLGLLPGDSLKVDHVDGNGLNNQRCNLRVCTSGQNAANRKKARKNTSGFKGAYRSRNRWISVISIGDKLRHLGSFTTAEEAARAYDKAALEQWGEFAHLNFAISCVDGNETGGTASKGVEPVDLCLPAPKETL